MVPVKLTLEGIYSYRERQTIDFTRLTDARLFGIFGPVGSGKSTIVEAMIYAVYGVIDRLNNEVKYNLMNLRSDRLFVDFEFRAGEAGCLYRATVECKRSKKKFMEVSTPKFLYHVWENGEWMPRIREEVIAAIGLNVQNFKRVVIIPQGKFQDFLMLRDKERTEMMMELFGELRRYDLGGKVAYLEGETSRKAIDLRGQLTGLGEVDVTVLAEEKVRLVRLQEETERLKKCIREGQEKEAQWKKVKSLVDEQGVRVEEEKKLLEQREEINALQRQVEEYEVCLQHFQQPLGVWESACRRLADVEKALVDYRERLVKKKEEVLEFKKQYNQLGQQYDQREGLKERAVGLGNVIRLRVLSGEKLELEGRYAKGNKLVETTRSELEVLRQQLTGYKEELARLTKSIPDMKLLSDIREWYSTYHHLLEENKRVREELEVVVREIREEEERVAEYKREHTLLAGVEGTSYEELSDACRKGQAAVETELARVREEWMHLNTRQRLVDFAKELVEGEPCPLCGAMSHPVPLHAETMEGELSAGKEQIAVLEQRRESIGKLLAIMAKGEERVRSREDKRKQVERKSAETRRKLDELLRGFVWEGFVPDDMQRLTREIDMVGRLNEERKKQEGVIATVEAGMEKKRGDLEKYTKRLEEIHREVVQRETQVELVRVELKEEVIAGCGERKLEDLKVEAEDCMKAFNKLEKDYRKCTEQWHAMENEYRKLEGGTEEKEREMVVLREEKKSIEKVLDELLAASVYADIAAVRGVLDKKLNLPSARERMNRYLQQLHAVEVRRLELEKLLTGVEYNAEEHGNLTRELGEMQDRERKLLAEHGALGNRIKDMEARAVIRARIGKELDGLEARLRNLQVLKSLFRGNDFVKFVSSIYLQNLCNAANERFYRMTRQRLKLELDEDNDFVVRDYMNEGRTRSARTLSGGQIFQASLSLALALTDNIRHLTGSDQNFFFLDEGFGSLDKESLRIVFDTLKSLRDENRVVGLISHVEEMQQELPVCLYVENLMERGSVVEMGL